MLLLIDNYDSFVFNLARYVAELGVEPRVVRNDALTVDDVARLNPAAVILSPGPCTPREAGICVDLVRELGDRIPMLGVCLGHQCLGAAFGAAIVRAPEPVHGRTSLIHHAGAGLFAGLPDPLRATRYHSLIVDEATLPAELTVTARTADGLIMALEHVARPLFGVQFHPESILTVGGHALLSRFLHQAGLLMAPAPAGSPPDGAPADLPAPEPPGYPEPDAVAAGLDHSAGFPRPDEPNRTPPLHW